MTEVQERLDLYVGLYEMLARCNGFRAHLRKFGVSQPPLDPEFVICSFHWPTFLSGMGNAWQDI